VDKIAVEPSLMRVFGALADPKRWAIVCLASRHDEVPYPSLLEITSFSQAGLTYHIRVLRQAGLITIRKEGQFYFYRLRREVLDDALDQIVVQAHIVPSRANLGPQVRRGIAGNDVIRVSRID
jgi:DNA-binding transcriptional ArsR family regulator